MATKQIPMADTSSAKHPLYDKWVLWAHLPHDTDWSISSYKRIATLSTVENSIYIYTTLMFIRLFQIFTFKF